MDYLWRRWLHVDKQSGWAIERWHTIHPQFHTQSTEFRRNCHITNMASPFLLNIKWFAKDTWVSPGENTRSLVPLGKVKKGGQGKPEYMPGTCQLWVYPWIKLAHVWMVPELCCCLDLLTCTDKHHCAVGPVKVADKFLLNLREAAFMGICAWWTSFLPCPPPFLILGSSCSTSPLGCNSSSPWTIASSRAFPTKYMSQRLPQASLLFVCLLSLKRILEAGEVALVLQRPYLV